MMFPRFDKLLTAETEVTANLLTSLGFTDGRGAARSLARIAELSLRRNINGAAQTRWSEDPSNPDRPAEPGEGGGDKTEWYRILERVLCEAPLRDTVLSVAEQFVENSRCTFDPFSLFEETPRSLEILARIACGSPFLTQTLLMDPASLAELSAGGRTAEIKSRDQFIVQVSDQLASIRGREAKLKELRRFQRREILRIGMCDAFGLMDLRYVTLQLSLLADAMVQVSLNLAAAEMRESGDDLVVLSLGKHGGEELNYSSDIDLVLISERDSSAVQRLARLTIDGLADNLPPGFLYRVDLRLRPWGDAGPLVNTPEAYTRYLQADAALWEKQALLKARVVAGNRVVGQRFLSMIRPLLFVESARTVRTNIRQMKERIESRLRQRGRLTSEVKLGVGSIRDVEFVVQFLQLTNARREPRVLSFNTLDSLVRLAEFGLLSAAWYRQLRTGYIFLRTVEHALQLLHNQQVHELPNDERQLEWLANRLDYPDAATLLQRFDEHRLAVRAVFEDCVGDRGDPADPADPAGGESCEFCQADPIASVARNGPDETARAAAPETEGVLPAAAVGLPVAINVAMLKDLFADSESIGLRYMTGVPAPSVTEAGSGVEADNAADDCLVLCGTEFRGWLSIISGLLSIYRLDIRSGEALTGGGTNRYGLSCPPGQFLIIFFVRRPKEKGATSDPGSAAVAVFGDKLRTELDRHAQRVRSGDPESVQAELIWRFGELLSERASWVDADSVLELDVRDDPESGSTLLSITGTDTPGFFFELTHALLLSRFRIRRAVVESDGDQVRDLLFVTEDNGSPVVSDVRRQELQTAVALIKQFMHWLPSAGNPHQALQRFRELLSRLQPVSQWPQNVESMRRPDVLHAIARALGVSPYLWEEFLQTRHEELFPLLANAGELAGRICREELSLQLDVLCRAAESQVEAWKILNAFKDRNLFRIDLRHVLGHCRPFGTFSDEITELAELIVAQAITIGWDNLVAEYGAPICAVTSQACHFAVAGLGKFGGVEMGYASDIEMMLVYEGTGTTAGPSRISNTRFFDLLVAAVASGISAREDGIFHVDLRMRPFGNAGSAAVSLSDMQEYYRADGPAWPYERQALAKFRCVTGNPVFAAKVTSVCHECIYSGGRFDFSAMHAMRERQIRQLVRGGSIHAKLSDGGIVDCEYALQALQLTFGDQLPTLQHPNSLRVLREAARMSLISPALCAAAEEAYVFLRELIDCLRMVRGSARDLTVPPVGTSDYEQLARRMTTIHDSRIPLEQLENQMKTVRDFAQAVELHCRTMRPK